MPVTGPGPDQGTGPRQVLATLPKVCGVQSCWWPPCHLGGRLQGQRTRTMAAAPGARAKVSCGSGRHRRHPSDDTWPLVAQRRGSRFWPGTLPKTMRDRALALLRWLRAGSYVSWTPGTIDLIFDGMEIWGSNLLDLVCHVMRQCRTQPMTHGSPGPPPGFTTLRHTDASPKLVRYRWCWPQIYSCAAASMHARPYDKGDNDDDYTEDMLGRSAVAGVSMDDEEMGEEEAKAGWNGSATPEGGDDDNNDNHDSCEQGEDTYKMPARSDIINIIIPAVARKKKNKPATMPDLRHCNHRAGQAGGLAGVSKLWTSLGRHPAWSAIWKALATEVTRCTAWCATISPDGRPSCPGRENSCSGTWWIASSSEKPMMAPGIFSVAQTYSPSMPGHGLWWASEALRWRLPCRPFWTRWKTSHCWSCTLTRTP